MKTTLFLPLVALLSQQVFAIPYNEAESTVAQFMYVQVKHPTFPPHAHSQHIIVHIDDQDSYQLATGPTNIENAVRAVEPKMNDREKATFEKLNTRVKNLTWEVYDLYVQLEDYIEIFWGDSKSHTKRKVYDGE